MWTLSRVVGYLVAVTASSAVFIGWMIHDEMTGPVGNEAGFISIFDLALSGAPVIVVAIGFLMLLPWGLVVYLSGRLHLAGPVYFGMSSAVAAFLVLSLLAGSLRGHGHPSLLDRIELAAGTSGIAVFVSGFIGGLVYWLLSEGSRRKQV
jgi:hypothetical protein